MNESSSSTPSGWDEQSEGEDLPESNPGSGETAGFGLDGSTPAEAGIQGRSTEAGSHYQAEPRDPDWEPFVEVDQPVQELEG